MVDTITIQWDAYQLSPEMLSAIRYLNQYSVEELLTELPPPMKHVGKEATFDYRVYTTYPHGEVEKVYILLNGFAERANTPDAAIKGLLSYLLAQQVDSRKHAVV